MIVKVLTPLSHNNEYLEPGTIVDLSDDVAETLLADKQPPITRDVEDKSNAIEEPETDPDKKGAFNKGNKKAAPLADVENTELPPVSEGVQETPEASEVQPAEAAPVDGEVKAVEENQSSGKFQ